MAKFFPQKNLQKYMNRIELAEKHRDNGYKDLWTRCYKRWRNYVDAIVDPKTKKPEQRSNISIPEAFTHVETIVPRIMETLFAARPYIAVRGREQNDIPAAEKQETLLDWQMNERMDFKKSFQIGAKTAAIYGTVIGYTGWKLDIRPVVKKVEQPVFDFDPMTGEPLLDELGQPIPLLDELDQPITEWQPMKMNEVEYDDPEAKFIDLGLFYVDPHAEDIDDARYCGHVTYESKECLQNMVEQGIYKIDWKKVEKQPNSNKARNERMSAVGLPTSDGPTESTDDHLFEVHHYWEDDKRIVILNRSYVAYEGENSFYHKRKPYKKAVYTLVPGEFYGMGVIEAAEDLFDELNTERNMRIDFRAFLLRRMFKVRRGANINHNELKWRQGGIVHVDDMDDVAEFGISDNVGSSFSQESTVKDDIKNTTGAHDVVMGTSNGSETATTTMTKDNNASMRFKLVISNMEELMTGIARLMIQMNQQFIDEPRVLRVTGEDQDEYIQIAPEEIQGEFDLIAMGSSVEPLANKEAYKQRMVELYGVVSNDPLFAQFPDKRRNLLKKVFEAFDIKDIESVLPDEQELLMMQQMMMQPPISGNPSLDPLGDGSNIAMMQEQGMMMP